MKILHVLISPRAEGTPRLVLDWLSVEGHEQQLLFLSPEGELRQSFEGTGVWQHYNVSFPARFKNFFQIMALVKHVCRKRKPDVVISWSLGFSHWIAAGARQAGIRKNLAHAGNPPDDAFVGRYIHTWISFTLGRTLGNKVIACSDYVRKSFTSIPFVSSGNIFSVYNCAQVERFLPVDRSAKRPQDFVMVATLEPHKDHATLLRAWALFYPVHSGSKLFIAGDGSLRDSLEELASSLALQDVVFLGSVKNVPDLLHRCATFVFSTTHNEGFGTVLIEALAAGCRIIASDVAACREVLVNGEYGTLVVPADPHALADAMAKHGMDQMAPQEQRDNQAYASRFSPKEMIRKYLEIADGSGYENNKSITQ